MILWVVCVADAAKFNKHFGLFRTTGRGVMHTKFDQNICTLNLKK